MTGAIPLAVAVSLSAAQLPPFDLERLELDPSGTGALLVGNGELLPPGQFRFSLAGHYERDPLLLDFNGQGVGAVISDRMSIQFGASVGVLRWLELGVTASGVTYQTGLDLSALGIQPPTSVGLGTPMAIGRVSLLRADGPQPFNLAFHLGVGIPVGSGDALAGGSGALHPKLLLGARTGAWGLNAEVGSLVRPSKTLGSSAIGSHLTAAAALTHRWERFALELGSRGSLPLTALPVSAEFFAGGRLKLGKQFELFALVARGLGETPGTPSYRALVGAALSSPEQRPVPVAAAAPVDPDDDGDGINNSGDACPQVAEDRDGFMDEDGCADPDNDQDGVADASDGCPVVAGPAQNGGCPWTDTDQDGLRDEEDHCPKESGPADRKGCPFRDRDKDGLEDTVDRCPDEAGPAETVGCPVKDTDQDTVADHVDNCPQEAGPAENQGCPKAQKQLIVMSRERLSILDKVYFGTNASVIQKKSFKLLNQLASVIRSHPEIPQVVIEGHTDGRGNAAKNRKLSQARAEAVRAYLIKQGIDGSRLQAKGHGPDRPIATNQTANGREQNRRVEFTIPSSQLETP